MNEVFVVVNTGGMLDEPIAVFATNQAARNHVRFLCRYENYESHRLEIFAVDFLGS